jgi:hypothetical protein
MVAGSKQRQWSRCRNVTAAATLWAVFLASAPSGSDQLLGFVRHCVGTVNIGSPVPVYPSLYGVAREGSTGTRMAGALDQGTDGDPFLNGRSHS